MPTGPHHTVLAAATAAAASLPTLTTARDDKTFVLLELLALVQGREKTGKYVVDNLLVPITFLEISWHFR